MTQELVKKGKHTPEYGNTKKLLPAGQLPAQPERCHGSPSSAVYAHCISKIFSALFFYRGPKKRAKQLAYNGKEPPKEADNSSLFLAGIHNVGHRFRKKEMKGETITKFQRKKKASKEGFGNKQNS